MDLQQAIDAGLQALDDGTEEEAAAALAPLVAGSPQSVRGWQVLGLLYRAQEASEQALMALGRARSLAPGDGLIANALAQARLEAGLDAVREFEDCLRLSPTAQVIQGMAAALAAAGRRGEAIALLEQTIATHPQWGEGHWVLSRLRWMNGERDGYLAALDQALASAPTDMGLWQTRLAIRQRSLDFEGLLADVPRALAATRDAAFVRVAQAAALSELGRVGEADALYASLPTATDLTDVIYRIRHLLRSGRAGDAAVLAEPIAAQAGAHIWPYLAVAWRLNGDRRWDWLERQQGLVRVHDIADRIDSMPALAERIRSLHEASAEPLEQSVRGGTQTDGPLFARIEPEIRQLRAAICSAVRDHIGGLPPKDPRHPQLGQRRDRPIRFAGAWSIRLSGAGHHIGHIHPEGWFSSAFYLALPPNMGTGANGDREGWLSFGQPEASLGVDLPPFDYVEPKVGRLALFPSTMWHATMPFAAGERMTVAFDVAPPRP